MDMILRITGGMWILQALAGVAMIALHPFPDMPTSAMIQFRILQGLAIGTSLAGGVGCLMYQNWGRKILLAPAIQGLAQIADMMTLSTIPLGSLPPTFYLHSLLSLATLVVIFLPMARQNIKTWPPELNETAFRLCGGLELLFCVTLAALLIVNSQDLESFISLIFIGPTLLLLAIGGLGMVFGKKGLRTLLLIVLGFHFTVIVAGSVLQSVNHLDFWRVLFESGLQVAAHRMGLDMLQPGLTAAMLALMIIIGWLPDPLPKR